MRRRGADKPKRDERRSVWDTRGLGWLDRLRRRSGREGERQVPTLNRDGEPTYVVGRDGLIGVRDTRGGVIKIPQPSRDPREWPEDWWGDGRETAGREIVVPVRSIRPWR